MADVARAAGVHQTTVSLALRNQGRIPEPTRLRIQELAHKMGYRPNPLVSALIASRRQGSTHGQGAALAFLTTGRTRATWKRSSQYVCLFDALRRHADARGYAVSEFWLDEPRLTPERARRILLARGIRGLVVCPLPDNRHSLDFDFSDFAAVALGLTLHAPALDHVAGDYFELMQHALRRLVDGSFKRVGFATESSLSERVNHASLAAFLAGRSFAPRKILEPCVTDADWSAVVPGWIRERKPDAVMVATQAQFNATRAALETAGLSVPGDVSLVCLDCHTRDSAGGMVRDLDEEARSAIEWLTSRLERGALGIPARARTILVGGDWRDGASVRFP
jgi:LacI family transcriptional regulator